MAKTQSTAVATTEDNEGAGYKIPPAVLAKAKTPDWVLPVAHVLATDQVERRINSLLAGTGLTIDRLRRVVIEQVTRNPKLGEFDRMGSLLLAICDSAKLGLLPDGVLGTGALVPVGKNEVQFRPMYRGLMQLARRSGDISSIFSHIVYEHEYDNSLREKYGGKTWDFHNNEPVLPDHIQVRPAERGEAMGAYAVAVWERTSAVDKEFMFKEDIYKIRDHYSDGYRYDQNNNKQTSAWTTFEEAMWKKTVIRQLCKFLPADSTPYKAAQMDDYFSATGGTVHLGRDIHEPGLQLTSDYDPSLKAVIGTKTSTQPKTARKASRMRDTLGVNDDVDPETGEVIEAEESENPAPPDEAQATEASDAETTEAEAEADDGPDPRFQPVEVKRRGKSYLWGRFIEDIEARLPLLETEDEVDQFVRANKPMLTALNSMEKEKSLALMTAIDERRRAVAADE